MLTAFALALCALSSFVGNDASLQPAALNKAPPPSAEGEGRGGVRCHPKAAWEYLGDRAARAVDEGQLEAIQATGMWRVVNDMAVDGLDGEGGRIENFVPSLATRGGNEVITSRSFSKANTITMSELKSAMQKRPYSRDDFQLPAKKTWKPISTRGHHGTFAKIDIGVSKRQGTRKMKGLSTIARMLLGSLRELPDNPNYNTYLATTNGMRLLKECKNPLWDKNLLQEALNERSQALLGGEKDVPLFQGGPSCRALHLPWPSLNVSPNPNAILGYAKSSKPIGFVLINIPPSSLFRDGQPVVAMYKDLSAVIDSAFVAAYRGWKNAYAIRVVPDKD